MGRGYINVRATGEEVGDVGDLQGVALQKRVLGFYPINIFPPLHHPIPHIPNDTQISGGGHFSFERLKNPNRKPLFLIF